MKILKFSTLTEAKDIINELIGEIQIETQEKNNYLKSISEKLNNIQKAQELEKWLNDNLIFITTKQAYYSHSYIKMETNNIWIDYGVILLAQTNEHQQFKNLIEEIETTLTPLEYIRKYTNWDSELIDSVSYSFDYFEEENENLTCFEINELDKDYEYRKALREFIINEIENNLLND